MNTFKSINLKFFVYLVTERRLFISLLSVYFLTLPNSTAIQLGIFNAIWALFWFFLETPSSYFADNFWHKKTLLLSKVFQLVSVILYILWSFVWWEYILFLFIVATIFQSAGFAFSSGTKEAFYHDLLEKAWKEKHYTKFKWKQSANVSLISAFMIALLPFMVEVGILWPFYLWVLIDIVGLIAILLIPNTKSKILEANKETMFWLWKDLRNTNLVPIIFYMALVMWFTHGMHAFHGPYMENLWMPIAYLWLVMSWSRVVWFLVWHNIHLIEWKMSKKQFLLLDLALFSISFFSMSLTTNPYLVWLILLLIIWWRWWRGSLMQSFILNHDKANKNYKATVLSFSSQIWTLFYALVAFIMWYIMNISYSIWYLFISLFMTFSFLFVYYFIYKYD